MVPKNHTYHEQTQIDNTKKLRELQKSLPPFCRDFFRGIEPTTAPRTRIAYAYDLGIFFEFLHENNAMLAKKQITEYNVDILDLIKPVDIEEYLEFLSYYEKDGKEFTNDERGKARKLACLRSFYRYFFRNEIIKTNPAEIVNMPKLHDKEIIRLDVDEVASLLNQVENGTSLTKKQASYHEKTKTRDLALMTLLLGTGIRVSECVGLDINDVDFKNNGIRIVRKGGYETVVYFGEEVEDALLAYLDEREHIIASSGSENALFLSMQNRRISVRAVENLVKKYSVLVTSLKKITPHKLRSTYGTSLYRETGDIYLVADVLGHKNVNTTRKHYAAIEDERRKSAADKVRLRREDPVIPPSDNKE